MYSIPCFKLVKVLGHDEPCETVSRACPETGLTYVRTTPGDSTTAKYVKTQDIQANCDGCAENYGLALHPHTTVILRGVLTTLCTRCAGIAGVKG